MWYDWGNQPIWSTTGPQANPSTQTLLAELDSTQLGTKNFIAGQSQGFRVTWIIGGDTVCAWQLEQSNSTALDAGVVKLFPRTPVNQHSQFVTTHVLELNQRLRARLASSNAGAAVYAAILAEPLT